MSGDGRLYWNKGKAGNLGSQALKKLMCTTPTPCFAKKSPERIENKGSALQKATKSSEDIDINRDKSEMRGESGIGGVCGARWLGVLKNERRAVERREPGYLGRIR
jgi:hypothetical protein